MHQTITCNLKEDRHAYFWLSVDLALVLPHVPQLGVLDLQGPSVREGCVQAGEPRVPGKCYHITRQDVKR